MLRAPQIEKKIYVCKGQLRGIRNGFRKLLTQESTRQKVLTLLTAEYRQDPFREKQIKMTFDISPKEEVKPPSASMSSRLLKSLGYSRSSSGDALGSSMSSSSSNGDVLGSSMSSRLLKSLGYSRSSSGDALGSSNRI